MQLDLEELEFKPSNLIEGFAERLEQLIPSLYNHYCSEGHPGGFFERVKDGTWMGHIIEHISLEIQSLAGMDCGFGRTRSTDKEGVYHVVIAYQDEEAGLYAIQAGVRIAEALINNQSYGLEADIQALRDIRIKNFPGPSTASILEEAQRRNVPILTLSQDGLYQLGYGARQKRIRASMGSTTSCIAVDVAGDKDETKYLLEAAGIPVPKGTLISSEAELPEAIRSIEFPIVIKPLDGHQGKGITVGIKNLEEAKEAFRVAQEQSDDVIIEQCIGGYDFRLLVVNYKFVAAAWRRAAAVTGDGQSTIQQLIDLQNSDPRRGSGHENTLTQIKVDAITLSILQEKGLTPDSVLPQGEILYLKRTANLSTGGTATDITDKVHPANKRLAERIARTIGLDICGIDIAAPDLDTPLMTNKGAVLEVNAAPGLRMHLAPSDGQARNVAAPILDMLFPQEVSPRIPIVAVTGTNGKTTVSRLIAHMATTAGYQVGFTTTDGIYIGGELVDPGDNTGPLSAQIVLKDSSVDFAVLECARGGLLRSGLGFDRCDIGIVTNVAADHLGLGGIHTVEQMAKVKAVIPESVHADGHALLNADDDLVYAMREKLSCAIAYFSLDSQSLRIQAHCQAGGLAAVLDNGMVTIYNGSNRLEILPVEDIPLTFNGTARYMIQNVLPAVLTGFINRFSIEEIRQALQTFVPSPETTPGRMNLFQFRNFQVMVDYAHNPAGLQAVGEFIKCMNVTPKVGIIAGVGDRRDEDIQEMGKLAGCYFDGIIIRLDQDLRGRQSEEIINLLRQGIDSCDASRPVTVVPGEAEALAYAIQHATEGSLIVHFTEKVLETVALVSAYQKQGQAGQSISEVTPLQEAVAKRV
jgi:cyanophycin synthetase